MNRRGFFQRVAAVPAALALAQTRGVQPLGAWVGPPLAVTSADVLAESLQITRDYQGPDTCQYRTLSATPSIGQEITVRLPAIGLVFTGKVVETRTCDRGRYNPSRMETTVYAVGRTR